MDQTHSVRFFNRGPSPFARLAFFSLLSLLLLFVDARYQYLESTRSILSTLIYPVQRLAALPPLLWSETSDYLTTQVHLVRDNQQLREQHALDAAQLLQLQDSQAENSVLRSMLDTRQRLKLDLRLSGVIYSEHDLSKRKLLLDLGAQSGVQPGQVVMDGEGVVGQVTRTYPLLSEVTLITNKDHEVPVQILRNGLRTILFGSGDTNAMELRYMPATADVQTGDLLVTSGIDGTYPPGLPVAKVSSVERDPAYPFAHVQCAPATGVNNQRWLFILSSPEKLPPRPESAAAAPVIKARKPRVAAP